MKVYIVSSDKESGISVANLLNRRQNMNAIVSESELESYMDEIGEVDSNLGEGFDYIILLSSDPYKASIDINKKDDARAVVCNNRADLSAASGKARANVIVLDKSKGKTQLLALVDNFVDLAYNNGHETAETESEIGYKKQGIADSALGFVSRIKESVPRPSDKVRESAREDQRRRKQKKQMAEGGRNEEDGDDGDRPKGKGLMGKIKYTFGIE